jgi:outer membrane protein TolC
VLRDGAGSDSPIVRPRTGWSVALGARLQLHAGGERAAVRSQSDQEIRRLRLQRDSLAQQIELRVRLSMTATGTSYPAIEFAQEAAEASRRNLELTTDSYSRGVVSIIDLLDAQNSALVAEQFAANAVWNFLSDLMETQRSAASYGFMMSATYRGDWYVRLERYFAENGFAVPGEEE